MKALERDLTPDNQGSHTDTPKRHKRASNGPWWASTASIPVFARLPVQKRSDFARPRTARVLHEAADYVKQALPANSQHRREEFRYNRAPFTAIEHTFEQSPPRTSRT